MPTVKTRVAAKRDLVVHFAYIGERAGVAAAERFAQASESSFAELARHPEIGAPGKIRRGRFAGVRLWSVKGFPKYLIAYRPMRHGVQIERVFHAAQDYQRILN